MFLCVFLVYRIISPRLHLMRLHHLLSHDGQQLAVFNYLVITGYQHNYKNINSRLHNYCIDFNGMNTLLKLDLIMSISLRCLASHILWR